VSLRRHVKFSSWLGRWLDSSLSPSDQQSAVEWLMMGSGRASDLMPCQTLRHTLPATDDKPPYYQHHRYHVTYDDMHSV